MLAIKMLNIFSFQLKLHNLSKPLLYHRMQCKDSHGSDEASQPLYFCCARPVQCIKFHHSTFVHQDTLPWESFHSFLSSTSRRFRSRYRSCALKFPSHYGKCKQLACWESLYRGSCRLRVKHVLRRFERRRYHDHQELRHAATDTLMLFATTELISLRKQNIEFSFEILNVSVSLKRS